MPAQTASASSASSLTPSFDAATIKPHPSTARPSWFGIKDDPDGVTASAATLQSLVHTAYGLRVFEQVSGAPDWAKSDQFDVQAKIGEADLKAMKSLSPADATARRHLMLQALLAERFSLKVHSEPKQTPVFELVVAKGGPKMKAAATDTSTDLRKDKDGNPLTAAFVLDGTTIVQGQSMSSFVSYLSWPNAGLGRPVLDKTGLPGTYNFTFRWSPPRPQMVNGVGTSPPADDAPSIYTALQEVGLKLQPATGSIETVVIDHVERPSEN